MQASLKDSTDAVPQGASHTSPSSAMRNPHALWLLLIPIFPSIVMFIKSSSFLGFLIRVGSFALPIRRTQIPAIRVSFSRELA